MADAATYIDPSSLPPDEKAAKLAFDSYDRSRRLLVDPKRDQWKEWKKAYRSVIDLVKDDNLVSRIVVPLIFTHVEALLPRLAAQTPKIEVWPRSQEDARRATVHRGLLKLDWQRLNLVLRIVEFVKSAEIYGTAWIKTSYRKTTETRAERFFAPVVDPFTGQPAIDPQTGRPRTQSQVRINPRATTMDGTWIDLPPVDQIFPDPDVVSEEECDFIVHRARSSLKAVKAARKTGGKPLYDPESVAELENLLREGTNPVGHTGNQETLREMTEDRFDDRGTPSPDPYKREFHLLECWWREKVIVVVEELRGTLKKPLRNDWNETGHLPFVRFTPIPDPDSIYGLSLPEVLMSLGVELSLLHSIRLDNLLSSVHNMWTVIRGSGLNSKNMRFRPGGILPVRDHGDIAALPNQPVSFSAHRETDEIKDWAERVGLTDTAQGIGTPGATATEANLLAEASGSRASLMFRILGHQTLTPMGRQLIRLNELNIDDERLVRILGDSFNEQEVDPETGQLTSVPPEFDRISPEELVSKSGLDLDITIDLASVEPGNAQVRLQRAERILPTLVQNLPPDHPAVQAAWVEYFRGTGISENPEGLFNSAEAQASIQREREAEQAEQEESTQPPGQNARTSGDQLAATQGAQQGGGPAN